MQELSGAAKDTAVKDTSAAGRALQAAKENPLFAILNPSYFQNENQQSELTKGPVIGLALSKDTAKINRIFKMEQVQSKDAAELQTLLDREVGRHAGKSIPAGCHQDTGP
jgi:SecD/SecF fusion protein